MEKGNVLAVIDPRPFEVQLAQGRGPDGPRSGLSEKRSPRSGAIPGSLQQDSIPGQQLDTQEALVRQYEGIVKADQGQIDGAGLQLTYCRITAPVSGRIGLRLVDPGNMVHAADANGLGRHHPASAHHGHLPIPVVFTGR